jgi:CelD/BcsL family acetyltransferase involved in cellulose biosynthesis
MWSTVHSVKSGATALSATFGPRPDDRAWLDLLSRAPGGTQFLSPGWFSAWEQTFAANGAWRGTVDHLTVRDGDRLAGVLPLCRQRVLGVSMLSLPGYYFPFRDIPVDAGAVRLVTDAMVRELTARRGGAGVRIGPMDVESPVRAALLDSLREKRWRVIELGRGHLKWLDLPGSVEAHTAMIRGRAKKADYFLRRMRKAGDVRLEVRTALDAEGNATLLRELQDIESRSWVATSGNPRFMGEQNGAFWTRALAHEHLGRAVKTWMLYLDDAPVSFCMVIDAGPVRHQVINGYAQDAGRFSTGHIIFKAMIHDALERGMERINFGLGDPGHKAAWGARRSSGLTDIIALRPGAFGGLAVSGYRLLSKLRRWRQERRKRRAA